MWVGKPKIKCEQSLLLIDQIRHLEFLEHIIKKIEGKSLFFVLFFTAALVRLGLCHLRSGWYYTWRHLNRISYD